MRGGVKIHGNKPRELRGRTTVVAQELKNGAMGTNVQFLPFFIFRLTVMPDVSGSVSVEPDATILAFGTVFLLGPIATTDN